VRSTLSVNERCHNVSAGNGAPEVPMTSSTATAQGARRAAVGSSSSRSFLSDVVIDYGPREKLSRLLLRADTEMRQYGLSVSFVPFDELVAINRANADSWRPILPIFDPEIGGVSEKNGFAIVGRDASGRAAYAHACRLHSLGDATLKEEIESLRLFYADPERSRGEGEALRVSAPTAATTTGQAVFIGAVWYRPDFRAKNMMRTTSPLARAIAFTRWYCDFSFSFMAEELVRAGTAEKARFPHVEWEIDMVRTPVYRAGHLRAALVWTNMAEHLQHFDAYLGSGQSQVDPVVEHGTAEHQRRA
jgi:hypothetical protein